MNKQKRIKRNQEKLLKNYKELMQLKRKKKP